MYFSKRSIVCGKEIIVGQYCDSAKLERNWFHWLLSSSVPDLESYRIAGLLWTKVVGVALNDQGKPILKNGEPLPDPSFPKRLHCVIMDLPYYFESNNDKIPDVVYATFNGETISRALPRKNGSNLLSEIDQQLQYTDISDQLLNDGYIQEIGTNKAWHSILEDVDKMCQGISMKFNLPSEEEQLDLANEALLQVTNKIKLRKLVYTPGRAPVFNLLTTTIYRCMYSIMNRRKTQRNGMHKLIDKIISGSIPTTSRSLKINTIKSQ